MLGYVVEFKMGCMKRWGALWSLRRVVWINGVRIGVLGEESEELRYAMEFEIWFVTRSSTQ